MLCFGGDPEVFVVDANGNAICPTIISQEPKVVMPVDAHGGFNRDGMAFELNPAPSINPMEVAENIAHLLTVGASILTQVGGKFVQAIGIDISGVDKDAVPRDVYLMGCDPDWNAYTHKHNRIRVNPEKALMRFAGGHISVQLPFPPEFEELCEFTKLVDYHAGLYSLKWSTAESVLRRKVYGKAGAFRWHPERCLYEYRTPDAGWVFNSGYADLCERIEKAWHEFSAGIRLRQPDATIKAINECNVEMASNLLGEKLS